MGPEYQVLCDLAANFGQLSLISNTHIPFQNPGTGSMITEDKKMWTTV